MLKNNFPNVSNNVLTYVYICRIHNTNYKISKFFFRENLRCLNIMKNRLETCHEIIGNKQIVRDSWIHEKVSRDLEGIIYFSQFKELST